MLDEPLISIILPIYNIKSYLPTCMNSIFKQTYKNIEIIMINDGSTDGREEICDNYRNNEKVIVYHKKNGGLSDARNYGIERAKGEYITCIDPDDYVDKDYVEYLYYLIKKYGTLMSICQNRIHYNNGKIKENGSKGDEVLTEKECLERMMYHDVIDTSACAKLYHKRLFNNVNYPKGKLFEDIGTTYALMLQCDFIAVGYESKYNYIFHNNSIVNGAFNLKKLDLIEMTDKMAKDVYERFPDLGDALLRRQVYARLSTINQMLTADMYKTKRQELIDYVIINRKKILKNKKSPFRDKLAIAILSLSYRLYRFCWLQYRKRIMGELK